MKHNLTMVHQDICLDLNLVTAVVKNEEVKIDNGNIKKIHTIIICLENSQIPIIYSSEKKEEIDEIYKKTIQI